MKAGALIELADRAKRAAFRGKFESEQDAEDVMTACTLLSTNVLHEQIVQETESRIADYLAKRSDDFLGEAPPVFVAGFLLGLSANIRKGKYE